MNAAKIMRKGFVTCRQEEALKSALKRMERLAVDALPVVDDCGHLVAMLGRDDAKTGARKSAKVADAMQKKAYCCRPGDTLSDVEASLREQSLAVVPILDERDVVCGIVSMADIPWSKSYKATPAKPLLDLVGRVG